MKASGINYLVDAGPLIGLLDKGDQWHEWSRETLEEIDEPLATTETALAEACHALKCVRPALEELTKLIAQGRIIIGEFWSERPTRIEELIRKYPEMDVGDATLVGLSELHGQARLITVDQDFRYYRKNGNQQIHLVIPLRN